MRVLLVVGLLGVVGIAALSIGGPGLLTVETAIVALGVGLGVVSVVLLGLLFSMRANVRAAHRSRQEARAARRAGFLVPGDGQTPDAQADRLGAPTAAPVLSLKDGATGPHVLHVDGIDDRTAVQLNTLGIYTVDQLGHADPEVLAAKMHKDVRVVRGWQSMGALLGVHGLGPLTARILYDCGIDGPDALAHTDPQVLARAYRRAAVARGLEQHAANVDARLVAHWAERAEQHQAERHAARRLGPPLAPSADGGQPGHRHDGHREERPAARRTA